VLGQANAAMQKKEYSRALRLYNYLLGKKYKSGIITLNKGVCYFETGDYAKAYENFNVSKNETKSAQAYLYLAYTCFKMKHEDEAKSILKEGMSLYNSDQGLKRLYNQIAQESIDVKDTNRNAGQGRRNKDK
jgi:tetratricopeptide (TPR) repeat protein